MEYLEHFLSKIESVTAKVPKLYIYGAGLYARNIYTVLRQNNISIDGFLVTQLEGQTELYGLPVLQADCVLHNEIGVIIGTNSLNRVAIADKLRQSGFDMAHVIYGTDYIEKSGKRYDGSPTMQITTRIGCSVNCRFCPQSLLVQSYFAADKDRESVMSLETFARCLRKLPEDARVSFCGMAEPFLNPQCSEMIKMAHQSGRTVELYTTLVGADRKMIEEIAEIPFGYVTLHVADRHGYAHIPATEEYYELIAYVVNYRRRDGSPFVNMCNAQAEPDERVAQICKGKYEILTALHDRAGNLQSEELLGKSVPDGKLSCSLSGTKLNHNNLLPDGTVLLCDFDYGLQHVLGNLSEQTYEEICSGSEWQRVRRGMAGDLEQDILCRKCSCANSIVGQS